MINIYLCEDNKQQRERYSHIIENILTFHDLDQRLFCKTASPQEVLKTLQENPNTGLYFLDINLQADIDGLQLAQKIRACDPRGYIVFITTHSEMLTLTFQYRVEAMDFILKEDFDQLHDRIRECMMTASANDTALQRRDDSILIIKIDNAAVYQSQKDILFIESDSTPHKIVIHTQTGTRNIPRSLKEIEGSLNTDFIRCHNSVIVNLRHVSAFDSRKRILTMDNGEQVPVSVRMRHRFTPSTDN